ncbi:hypothetical protein ACFL6S_36370 [Candidatus Poribacteria bacterium]
MQRVSVAGALVSLLIAFVAGCAMLASPEWSENFALEATLNVPEMNDGSMYSSGKTQPAVYIRGERADDSRYTDVLVTFKEPKDVRKITIRRRSEDNTPVDVNVFAMMNEEWKLISDATRGADKDDVNILIRAKTDKLRIRSQRATRTAGGKTAINRSGDGGNRRRQIESILREPIKYAEVEVYGLKPKTEATES